MCKWLTIDRYIVVEHLREFMVRWTVAAIWWPALYWIETLTDVSSACILIAADWCLRICYVLVSLRYVQNIV